MWSVRSVINIEGGRRGYASHLLTFPVTPEAQAIFSDIPQMTRELV
jgi:hypothetical protein